MLNNNDVALNGMLEVDWWSARRRDKRTLQRSAIAMDSGNSDINQTVESFLSSIDETVFLAENRMLFSCWSSSVWIQTSIWLCTFPVETRVLSWHANKVRICPKYYRLFIWEKTTALISHIAHVCHGFLLNWTLQQTGQQPPKDGKEKAIFNYRHLVSAIALKNTQSPMTYRASEMDKRNVCWCSHHLQAGVCLFWVHHSCPTLLFLFSFFAPAKFIWQVRTTIAAMFWH